MYLLIYVLKSICTPEHRTLSLTGQVGLTVANVYSSFFYGDRYFFCLRLCFNEHMFLTAYMFFCFHLPLSAFQCILPPHQIVNCGNGFLFTGASCPARIRYMKSTPQTRYNSVKDAVVFVLPHDTGSHCLRDWRLYRRPIEYLQNGNTQDCHCRRCVFGKG